jgi:CheY-like chemotaxis protein
MKKLNVDNLVEVINSDTGNAMHSILGFLELLSEGALDPAQRAYVEACRDTADRHCRGIEDVRLVLGLIPEERQTITDFALENLFVRVAEVIEAIAGRKGVSVHCDIDSGVPPFISADINRLGHVLLRVTEAVMSTLDGGELHLTLNVLAATNGSALTLEIFSDSSILSPALLRAVQQDEFEFDASFSGSGVLGLAAARKLATGLGGRLDFSDASTGVLVVVTIPVGIPSNVMVLPQREGLSSQETQRALRILVAEDSDDSFQLFKAYLRGQPHSVARAINGEVAVELAATGAFDLIFMDIRMPVMDGYAATRRIRELETGKDCPRIPIVVLSAEDLRAQRREGALVGCSGHLSKPLRKHELLEAIRVYSVVEFSVGDVLSGA